MHKASQALERRKEVDALKAASLRPTRQRVELLNLLMADGDRHVTAEVLHSEARGANISVSLATVYNTLNQFTESGLLKRLAVDPGKTYFDTNTSVHHHFYDEARQSLVDIPTDEIACTAVPNPPEGANVESIEILVRISSPQVEKS